MNSEALKTPPHMLPVKGSWRMLARMVMGMCLLIPFLAARGQQPTTIPTWWETRSVLKSNTAAVDYAIANQGQLKNFARAARDEMLARHLIENGHLIDQMVSSWTSNTSGAVDYSIANLGQLKKVVAPFYDQLAFLGLRPYYPQYPWPDWSLSAKDYAAANLGQLKNMFVFEIPEASLLEYAPGLSARFWNSYAYNGMVSSGIVAGDQTFQNSFAAGVNPTVTLKGGSYVQINQYGVYIGVLAEDQALKYTPVRDAVFKAGTQIQFSSTGFVLSGTLASDQLVNVNAADGVEFKAGTAVFFDWSSGYCYQGTLAANQTVKYNTDGDSTLFKGATDLYFFGNGGYVTRGTLSGNQPVKYNADNSATFQDGSEIQFSNGYAWLGFLSGNQAVKHNADGDSAFFKDGTEVEFSWDGYASYGTLSGNQAVKHNSEGDSAVFKDGSEIQFSDGYAWGGTLSGNQPVKYNAANSAIFQDGSEIHFTEGYVSTGALFGDQSIDYRSNQSAVFAGGTQANFSFETLTYGQLAHAQPLYYSDIETRAYPLGQLLSFDPMTGFPSIAPQSLGAEDSDNDGLIDLFEMHVFGSLQEGPESDSNNNGISNQDEMNYWIACCGAKSVDLLSDEDHNGLTTLEELMLGVHPLNATITFLNPITTDTDGDGVADAQDDFPFDPLLQTKAAGGAPPVIVLESPSQAQPVP